MAQKYYDSIVSDSIFNQKGQIVGTMLDHNLRGKVISILNDTENYDRKEAKVIQDLREFNLEEALREVTWINEQDMDLDDLRQMKAEHEAMTAFIKKFKSSYNDIVLLRIKADEFEKAYKDVEQIVMDKKGITMPTDEKPDEKT